MTGNKWKRSNFLLYVLNVSWPSVTAGRCVDVLFELELEPKKEIQL